jgi:hypothetical protein
MIGRVRTSRWKRVGWLQRTVGQLCGGRKVDMDKLAPSASQATVAKFGPTVSAANSKGRYAIRNDHWLLPGASSPHQLALSWVRWSTDKVRVTLDGEDVDVFHGPSFANPATVSGTIMVDGQQICVYVQMTANPAATGLAGIWRFPLAFSADVFLNGRSLLDGSPLKVLSERIAEASNDPEVVRGRRLASPSGLVWVVSVGEIVAIASRPTATTVPAIILVVAGNFLVLKAGARGIRFAATKAQGRRLFFLGAAVIAVALVGLVAVLTYQDIHAGWTRTMAAEPRMPACYNFLYCIKKVRLD